jgi:hypothetical protein
VKLGLLLRLAATALAALACASLLAGAKQARTKRSSAKAAPSAAQAPAAAEAQPQPPPPPQEPPPSIPLCVELRLVIRPTLLGLIPPDDPDDFGEVLVRVTALAGEGLDLRYEIKERVLRKVAVKSVFTPAAPAEPEHAGLVPRRRTRPAPTTPVLTKTVAATRIRRGLIEARREPSEHRAEPPLFWSDGDWQTPDGLLWLSSEAYAELTSTGRTAWNPAPAEWADSPALSELKQLLAKLRRARGLGDDAPVQLELHEAQARYPAYVNGVQVDLPCLTATDSLGLAKYWILADAANPLLLKLTYVTGTGVTATEAADGGRAEPESEQDTAAPASGAGDAGAAAPAGGAEVAGAAAPAADSATDAATPPTARDPRRPVPRLRQRTQPVIAAEDAGAAPHAAPGSTTAVASNTPLGVIAAGSGYAVVEIDF